MFCLYWLIGTGVIFLLVTFVMSLTTVKKIDTYLINDDIDLPANYAFLMPNSWGRAMTYSVLIWCYNVSNTKNLRKKRYQRYQRQYRDFNFKTCASNVDLSLSFLNLLFCFLGVLCLLAIIFNGVFS